MNETAESDFFTTSRGVTVRFLSIRYLLDKLPRPQVEPPYYEVKTATGAVEKHAHDETTIQTDEERAAWSAYLLKHAQAIRDYDLAFTKLVLMRGIDVEMPADDAWVKEQEFFGIPVPSEPLERRWHWLQTEVVAGKEDTEAIILGVLAKSDVSEETLSQMAASFRHPLGHAQVARPDDSGNGAALELQPAV